MDNQLFQQPVRFQPLFRPYIWGGRNLETSLQKPIPLEGVWAESWEIVDHGADQSIVVGDIASEGLTTQSSDPKSAVSSLAGKSLRQLIEMAPESVLGVGADSQSKFPLLLKYLDCQRVLSIQVHPNDAYGTKMFPPDLGKTEAWYIVDASDDALIYAGLKTGVDRSALVQAIADGRIESCLHSFHPNRGDCVFIPAGTVHALGAGLIVAEIQQASDTTFRLYDWSRVGADGAPRPLHIDQALDVINFDSGPISTVVPKPTSHPGRTNLVTCDRFVLDKVTEDVQELSLNGQFAIATVVQGNATIENGNSPCQSFKLSLGQSVLLPAAISAINISMAPNSILLLATPPIR
ncbi:MAG: class I mannose-6-phosphate isomerase [Planctomycetota bacterium]|nr:class I mannose-6-phosphate isomerase [Planctomycetota bacterium]